MRLAELLPDVAGIPADLEIRGLVMDSREVTPRDAFVAIAGFGAHGLNFVEQARAAGASAILFEPPAPADMPAPADAIAVPGLRERLGAMADRFHDHPSAAMTMVGVTGTNGKTSTVPARVPSSGHACASNCTVEVLPLVPVTPAVVIARDGDA